MNRDQARQLVRDTLTQLFDKGRFINFIGNLLNHINTEKAFACNSQYVKDAFKPHVNRYERLATYIAPDERKVDILIVHLTREEKLTRARTALRNFVADYLKNRGQKDAALVAFVSPSESVWRFSYVKMEYATVEKPSGDIDTEARLTPARRFSYLVGPEESCHTAQTRFLDLLQETQSNPELKDIEDAFSVEAVTKEFFLRYKELFLQTMDQLDALLASDKAIAAEFGERKISTADFAKKLLGQIVFLYFLQKKGWLGVPTDGQWGDGPHNFLRKLANGDYGQRANFFNDTLEPLFYDTLATDRGHEAFCGQFNCRIPFLNGGLFEPLNGYDWRKTEILLPNRLFTNTEPVEEGITGTGILDVFDRYNFTVNEAEPLEKEVAIDPEMLGKVFENLLEVKERKSKGSYYTPREIVHYMCQESLINYLDTAINNPGNTGIPACGGNGNTDIPVCAPASAPSSSTQIHKTRRNLPHWTSEGSIYWITFRLADSLPQEKLGAWHAERDLWLKYHPQPWSDDDWREYDECFGERLQSWLDAGYGSCALVRPEVRQIVQDCLLRFEGERLRLHAGVIMPNHVHLLLEPLAGNELSELLKGIKGASARKANQILKSTGTAFWMDESYDHIVRSERQYKHFSDYIANNPVKSKLSADQFWLFQSDSDSNTGIPACAPVTPEQEQTRTSVSQSSQTGMSVLREAQAQTTQTRMSVLRSDIETLIHIGDQAAHYEAARVSGTTSYSAELPKSIVENARLLDEKLAAITVCDPAIGSGAFPVGMMQEIVRARTALTPYFNDVHDRTTYHFKRHAIQNCLYGVDIDPSAVEIAKLRLWLSLVVDEEEVQQIKPLPNLDYKVVVGNSLLGVEKTLFNEGLFERLEELKPKYFDETNNDKKQQHRREIDQIIHQLTNGKEIFDFEIYFSEIFLHEKKGFDVVVGNPPYVSYGIRDGQTMTTEEKNILKSSFPDSAEYKISLYAVFMEKGIRLAHQDGGIISFIVPDSFLLGMYFSKIRNYILQQCEMNYILLLPFNVFGAVVGFSVVYQFARRKKLSAAFNFTARSAPSSLHVGRREFKQHSYPQNYFIQQKRNKFHLFFDAQTKALVEKCLDNSVLLKTLVTFRSGLIGKEGQFAITSKTKSNTKWQPGIISGGEIRRYSISPQGYYLLYDPTAIKSGFECVDYFKPKLFLRQTGDSLVCAYDCKGLLCLNNVHVGNAIRQSVDLLVLAALLNSKLLNWYYQINALEAGRVMPQTDIETLGDLPIRTIQKKENLTKAVDRILEMKAVNAEADTSVLEKEIDQLVYQLYGLTPEEIAIVEGATAQKSDSRKRRSRDV